MESAARYPNAGTSESDRAVKAKEDMTVERTPTAFGDLRGWIAALERAGEL
jgi:hypothetical protein